MRCVISDAHASLVDLTVDGLVVVLVTAVIAFIKVSEHHFLHISELHWFFGVLTF